MGWRACALVLCLAAGLVSCGRIAVRYDYDTAVDFAGLDTFDWLPAARQSVGSVQAAVERNSLQDRRIREAIVRGLEARGLKRDPSDPALFVAYHVEAAGKPNVTAWGSTCPGMSPCGGWSGSSIELHQQRQGTLILDLVEADSRELIWRGIAEGALGSNLPPQKARQAVHRAVEQLLKEFPPPGSR